MEIKPPKMGYEGNAGQAAASLGDDLWELHAAAQKIAEFTAGRTMREFREMEVLQAAALSMLQLMDTAALRIERQSPETGKRLEDLAELHALVRKPETDEVWRFIEATLPALVTASAIVLEEWHDN
jgi:uncharacterized protein with HEPN domain